VRRVSGATIVVPSLEPTSVAWGELVAMLIQASCLCPVS